MDIVPSMTLNKKRIRKTLWKINLSFYNRAQIHIQMGRKSWKYFGDYNVNTSFVVVRRKCALFPNKNGKETNFPWYATNKPQRKPKRWYRMQCIIKINSLFPNAHKTCGKAAYIQHLCDMLTILQADDTHIFIAIHFD